VRLDIVKKRVLYRNFEWFYAEKGGGCVQRGEAHWTKINGFMVQMFGHAILFQFRRVYKL
jgi:hypothetical protein